MELNPSRVDAACQLTVTSQLRRERADQIMCRYSVRFTPSKDFSFCLNSLRGCPQANAYISLRRPETMSQTSLIICCTPFYYCDDFHRSLFSGMESYKTAANSPYGSCFPTFLARSFFVAIPIFTSYQSMTEVDPTSETSECRAVFLTLAPYFYSFSLSSQLWQLLCESGRGGSKDFAWS